MRQIQEMQTQFSVRTEHTQIGGVPVAISTPKEGVSSVNKGRILISLHEGGFIVGLPDLETIPIAGLGGFRVVGVDYRLGPEHPFPAASADVAAVYRQLLKKYPPRAIGIYGCGDAGALLAAESVAWFQKSGLPVPGALGLFGNGAAGIKEGDTMYLLSAIVGRSLLGNPPWRQAYFGAHPDFADPLIAPLFSPRVMGRFPPTLLISSTRDEELSNVAATQAELVRLGVPAELHVWEGLGYCFMFYSPRLPESRDAFNVIVKYFESHLGVMADRASKGQR